MMIAKQEVYETQTYTQMVIYVYTRGFYLQSLYADKVIHKTFEDGTQIVKVIHKEDCISILHYVEEVNFKIADVMDEVNIYLEIPNND